MTRVEERWEATMLPNYGTPELLLTKGKGVHVTDDQGVTYLDLLAGLAVNILGHAHPAVIEAVQAQIATLGHTSNLYANEPGLRLAERLQARVPGHKVALLNSGTEANELAYKAVRKRAHHAGHGDGVVLAFEKGFHGRTTGALALTGQPAYHDGFTPFMPGVLHTPYNDIDALERVFETENVVGVFVEYLQGEGGVVPIDEAFAKTLHALAAEQDALVVADEVQTGVGRTGHFFAHEHLGVEPDIITIAKGIGGGLPVGACLVRPDVAGLMGPGTHGCTFGGNPIACAAANAVLDVYEAEDLAGRAAKLGEAFKRALADALAAAGVDASPRGWGLLMGVPLGAPKAGDVVKAVRAEGLLVGQAGKQVVRFAPPLIIEERTLVGAAPTIAAAVAQQLSV